MDQHDFAALLGEIVEIKALRLAVFIVGNYQIGDGLGLNRGAVGVSRLLALGLPLRLLNALFLARAFLLSFRESRARASCHRSRLPLLLIQIAARSVQCLLFAVASAARTRSAREKPTRAANDVHSNEAIYGIRGG